MKKMTLRNFEKFLIGDDWGWEHSQDDDELETYSGVVYKRSSLNGIHIIQTKYYQYDVSNPDRCECNYQLYVYGVDVVDDSGNHLFGNEIPDEHEYWSRLGWLPESEFVTGDAFNEWEDIKFHASKAVVGLFLDGGKFAIDWADVNKKHAQALRVA